MSLLSEKRSYLVSREVQCTQPNWYLQRKDPACVNCQTPVKKRNSIIFLDRKHYIIYNLGFF